MEDGNVLNKQSNDDGNGSPSNHRGTCSRRSRKQPRSDQVMTTTSQIEMNQISDSSIATIVVLAHTFGYQISNLPDSLLVEILARLPVESIFRFKSVCKHWLSLLSHPSFRHFYLSRLLTPKPTFLSLFRICYRYIYASKFEEVVNRFNPSNYDSSNLSVLFLFSPEEERQTKYVFKVLSMSNGLILCCSLGPLVYYVCDPISRQVVTLPQPRIRNDYRRNRMFIGEGLTSRVNQESVLTSYAVVRVEWSLFPSKFLHVQVFSSDVGEWVDYYLPCAYPIRLLKRGGSPIQFNGILHWFVHDHGMVAFDPFSDQKSCRLIKFPEGRDSEGDQRHDGLYRLCDESRGELRYFEVPTEADGQLYCFRMWVLEDYENGRWRSEFQVARRDLSSNDSEVSSWLMRANFIPLSFDPFNLDIVYLRCVELACVLSYNIQSKSLDIACKPIGVVEDISWRMVMPFVVPRWPTPIPGPCKKLIEQEPASDLCRSKRLKGLSPSF